jgi:hypothetical protein
MARVKRIKDDENEVVYQTTLSPRTDYGKEVFVRKIEEKGDFYRVTHWPDARGAVRTRALPARNVTVITR